MKSIKGLVILGVLMVAAVPAFAQTTADIEVTASVKSQCVFSAVDITFPEYDTFLGTAVTATGSVSVQCTKGTQVSISMNSSGSMSNVSGDTLDYTLAYSGTGWDAATPIVHTAASKAEVSLQIDGTVGANQDVPAGSYAETVTATFLY